MGKFDKLLSPFTIGNVQLKNRVVIPAMGTGYPTLEGQVTQQLVDYYEARARGGFGLMITEGHHVVPTGQTPFTHLNISRDQYLLGDKKLTDVAHRNEMKIGMQLAHPGREATESFMGSPVVAPSPLPSPVKKVIPRELTIAEIKQLVECFVQGAVRAHKAEYDLVEILAGHGYLVSQFLSPFSNIREDEYGGSLEGRSRFLVEIVSGIKEVLGEDILVSCRINGSDFIKGGLKIEDTKEIAQLLVRAGTDVLHITAGVYGSFPNSIPPVFQEQACFTDLAAEIKKVVEVPVITVGRIADPLIAEKVLAEGKADLVAMGRASLADPEFPNKLIRRQEEQIRPCIGCNQGCIDVYLLQESTNGSHKISCLVNPRTGRERDLEVTRVSTPKKVAVVGGGPGGMEAAAWATERGHVVTLFEKSDKLGGQFALAAAIPGKEEFGKALTYMANKLDKLGIEVRLGQRATAEQLVAEEFDKVVIATGSKPLQIPIPGINEDWVEQAWNILSGKVQPGKKVVIIGGGSVGLETAAFVADKGSDVYVIDVMKFVARDMGPLTRWYLRNELEQAGVKIMTKTKVDKIGDHTVMVALEEGTKEIEGVDQVILAVGAVPNHELAEQLNGKIGEIYVIGDAYKPRNALHAIYEAAMLGNAI